MAAKKKFSENKGKTVRTVLKEEKTMSKFYTMFNLCLQVY